MCNYYRINVAKNGAYLFATEAVGGGGGGITNMEKAKKLYGYSRNDCQNLKDTVLHVPIGAVPVSKLITES